jgi:hypothetical protein
VCRLIIQSRLLLFDWSSFRISDEVFLYIYCHLRGNTVAVRYALGSAACVLTHHVTLTPDMPEKNLKRRDLCPKGVSEFYAFGSSSVNSAL